MPKSKTDLLHDELDEAEKLSRQAAVIVRRTIQRELPIVMGLSEGKGKKTTTGDLIFALGVLIERVAQALAPLTTEAVHLGGRAGQRRSGKAK